MWRATYSVSVGRTPLEPDWQEGFTPTVVMCVLATCLLLVPGCFGVSRLGICVVVLKSNELEIANHHKGTRIRFHNVAAGGNCLISSIALGESVLSSTVLFI